MSIAAAQNFDFETAREHMVERQVRTWEVLDPAVLDVMRSLRRDEFVPAQYRSLAYADAQVPLGHGEVMMQPKVEGRLVQSLDIDSNDSILEIGTGSGWLTALLARLGGHVHSLDIREEFIAGAQRTLDAAGITNVALETRDAAMLDGITDQYDCIAVTGSMPTLHEAFCRQLKIGGRLFVIVGSGPIMEARLLTRTAQDAWTMDSLFDAHVPPLVNAWSPKRFEF
ncbi:MAG: protein-L-isoaspartate O-methyltransferase [Proteobacteria bacterium]|nr:protein-L-isoaspartate O-methyltransferase [Pseudomonadota bacterium]